MCIHVYGCMCMHVCACMCICMHACICLYVCVYVYVYACMCTYVCKRVCIHHTMRSTHSRGNGVDRGRIVRECDCRRCGTARVSGSEEKSFRRTHTRWCCHDNERIGPGCYRRDGHSTDADSAWCVWKEWNGGKKKNMTT